MPLNSHLAQLCAIDMRRKTLTRRKHETGTNLPLRKVRIVNGRPDSLVLSRRLDVKMGGAEQLAKSIQFLQGVVGHHVSIAAMSRVTSTYVNKRSPLCSERRDGSRRHCRSLSILVKTVPVLLT